jgi:hypothetical protein
MLAGQKLPPSFVTRRGSAARWRQVEPANRAIARALKLHNVIDGRLARGELGPRRLGQQDQINGPLDVLQLDCRHAGAAAKRPDISVDQLPARVCLLALPPIQAGSLSFAADDVCIFPLILSIEIARCKSVARCC